MWSAILELTSNPIPDRSLVHLKNSSKELPAFTAYDPEEGSGHIFAFNDR